MNDIHRIAIPTPFRIGDVNAYLLEGDPLTLVDPGPRWPRALATLEAGLDEQGWRIEDIELVLITHQHLDHFGLAAEVQRRADAHVAVLRLLADHVARFPATWEEDDDFAEDVMRHYGIAPARIRALRELSRPFAMLAEPVEPDELLDDGHEIVAGGRTWRVLARPGHSPTDTIFVADSSGMAIVGDHLLPRISSNPIIHRPPGMAQVGAARQPTLQRYLDSLRQTAELPLRTILPGHGAPTDDHAGLAALRIDHHMQRKEAIAGLIQSGLRNVEALSYAMWGDVETSQIYLALSEVVGHIDLLVAEGRLEERPSHVGVEFVPTA